MSGSSGGHTCSCFYGCRNTENGDLARTAKTDLLPQERYQLVVKSALFIMGYAHAYVPPMTDTCTELARGPRASGGVWRVMIASKWHNEKERGMVLGSEATSLASCHMTYNRPQVDSPES